jgi:hypothetical protein
MDFNASAVRPRSRERPLRNSPVPMDKMPRVAPVGIGESRPDFSEGGPHCLMARVPGAADIRARRGFKDTVIAHERHEGIDIVAVPRIGKGLQDLGGDLCNQVRHNLTLLGARTLNDAPDAQRKSNRRPLKVDRAAAGRLWESIYELLAAIAVRSKSLNLSNDLAGHGQRSAPVVKDTSTL